VERSQIRFKGLDPEELLFRGFEILESGSEDSQHLEGTGLGKMPDSVPENSRPFPVEVFTKQDLHDVRTEPGAVMPSVNIDPMVSHEVHGHNIFVAQAELIPRVFLSHAPNLM
jgi:hypothetical protein